MRVKKVSGSALRSMSRMEPLLAKELKRKFDQSGQKYYDRIYVSKRPYQVSELKRLWYDMYGRPLNVPTSFVPPLQPGTTTAIEKTRTNRTDQILKNLFLMFTSF